MNLAIQLIPIISNEICKIIFVASASYLVTKIVILIAKLLDE